MQRRPLRRALALAPRALDQLAQVFHADAIAVEQKVKDRVAQQVVQFRFAVDIAHLAFPFFNRIVMGRFSANWGGF